MNLGFCGVPPGYDDMVGIMGLVITYIPKKVPITHAQLFLRTEHLYHELLLTGGLVILAGEHRRRFGDVTVMH